YDIPEKLTWAIQGLADHREIRTRINTALKNKEATTWGKYKQLLYDAIEDPERSRYTTSNLLMRLFQKKEQSVSEYRDEFNKLLALADRGFTGNAIQEWVYNKASPDLRKECIAKGRLKDARTTKEMWELLLDLEQSVKTKRTFDPKKPNRTPSTNRDSSNTTNQSRDSPASGSNLTIPPANQGNYRGKNWDPEKARRTTSFNSQNNQPDTQAGNGPT
ncbi:hypothetical protein K402DRAFT_409049, partial [Aulographum hederae CBS 113979]